ncbi:hypothetical protein BDZ90DRAFT_230669 [Jaminaea rosea]|uniref:D-isomer specific 2-hydroxyacid dehydrogenase NAD-binding domain-containing protein n=1 Tax=Jaminaea rosea TaxID=1569628 RepID=A0A316UX71_9BASI|nr:hypothetical protein BDZ90DRAFT_230669 [Jaminaea rosea]PWN29832.1 hypothetical protein BDZ90DRAFT_230669 [Jaminaea rosea]
MSAAPEQHKAISAPIQAVDASRIPPAGPVAILPSDHPNCKRYTSDILSAFPDPPLAPLSKETRGVIWLDISAHAKLGEVLDANPQVGWVQLVQAGINLYKDVIHKHNDKVWTSAKGSFGQPVAEHALMMILGLLRKIPQRIRSTSWAPAAGLSLYNRRVTIVGAGGITLALLSQIAPFSPHVTVLRRRSDPLEDEVIPPGLKGRVEVDTFKRLHEVLPKTEVLVIAAALTPGTNGMIGARELELLPSHAVLVNVARGEHVQTDAIVEALRKGKLAGAGLDVTAPEPLPEGHPLWNLEVESDTALEQIDEELRPSAQEKTGGRRANVIITPHTADTPAMIRPLIVNRFVVNLKALQEGKGKFEGVVDNEHAY